MRVKTVERDGRARRKLRCRDAIVGSILLLVAAEISLGYWARQGRTPYEGWDRERETPTLVPGRYDLPLGVVEIDGQGFVARRSRDAIGREGDIRATATGPEDADPFRIVALGDSCTFGAGDPESPYPAALERLLNRDLAASPTIPPPRYSVFNAGIAGLNSDESIGRLMHALVAVHPDVVTIYLGWNDLMKDSPRAQTRAIPLSPVWRGIDDLWLVRGFRKLLFFHLRARFDPPRTGAAGATGRFADFRPDYFEANLRRLIAASRAAGARPLLVTLPHSLRRDLTPMQLKEPPRQFPYFYAGSALGDFVDLIDRYNETIRRVAQAEAIPVAPVAERFDRMTRKEDYFFDTMHPNRRGNDLIAEVLERTLREASLLEQSTSSAASRREE